MPTLNRGLDDQTQVDSKPAGQPEHASLNQCQLIAANRPKLISSGHPQLVVEIRFLCNVIDARALIGCCDALSGTPGMSPACNYRAYSKWSPRFISILFFIQDRGGIGSVFTGSESMWQKVRLFIFQKRLTTAF